MHRHALWILIFIVYCCFSCAPKEIAGPPKVEAPPKPAKIALVLGAGSSKGFAHIGVLKVLEINNVPIHLIVGTSVGSVVGSLYAFGYSAFEVQEIALSVEKGDVIDPVYVPTQGFVKGEKLEEFVNKMVKHTSIEKLKIPLLAVATDIQEGQEVIFGKGNTGSAVRASCSIPGIFRPTKIGDRIYVDGGVMSPVPVAAAKRFGADVVIAVDISSEVEKATPQGTVETILQAITIMYANLGAIQLGQANVVIKPRVGHIGTFDFTKRHEAILAGEKAALAAMPQVTQILGGLRREGRLE